MGNAAGIAVPPDATAALRQSAGIAFGHARHAAVIAHVGLLQLVRIAERYYAVVDERVLTHVHRAVEEKVVRRVQRLADRVEAASKLWFVKAISTTTIADAFDFLPSDVRRVQIEQRDYEVFNCGPELLDVPSWKKVVRVLELTDRSVTDFLLAKCRWAVWQPPTSWRVKVDQVFNVTVHVQVRRHEFLTNEVRVVRLRVGRKWVGTHHNDHGEMAYEPRSKWLHRVDYEIGGDANTSAESEFFQTVKQAWQDYLDELARLPKEDLRGPDETSDGFPYDEQEQRTSLRIKYLLESSLENLLNDKRTLFRSPHEFEQWRMEQEDAKQFREACLDDHMAGPLLAGSIDELMEYYEAKSMAIEDIAVQF